jgi:3-hydroxy-9,10-secoandrosta-1,3,5(10)-triene-9,17-dione monooxygenase
MHNWLLTKFTPQARAELFPTGRPYSHTAAPLAPTGTAKPANGGYRIDGRWEWATGVEHSHWVMVHAVQREPEFTTWLALVPIDDVEIEDVWQTSGMRATGSNVVRLRDVFVPEHRVVSANALCAPSVGTEGDAMAWLPMSPVLCAVGDGSGASAYFATSPLQRLQRDVETLKGHVEFDWDRTTELAGRIALGFEPRPTDMISRRVCYPGALR